jgi:MEMO1 family protein
MENIKGQAGVGNRGSGVGVQDPGAKRQGTMARDQQAALRLARGMLLVLLLLCLPITISAQEKVSTPNVRKPVFAGSFYPADKASLEKVVDRYLKEGEVKGKKVQTQVFGIMAPHAGYEYSGRIAGLAYSQLRGRECKTVVIVGSSHRKPFRGIALYPAGSWETPLGRVEIDQDGGNVLAAACKAIRPFPQGFDEEHSLEVQLPFLQRTLKEFRIVPLLIGSMEPADYRSLADAILILLRQNPKGTLIIASSDMSHYHSYDKAQQMDAEALRQIEGQDLDKLIGAINKGDCELCGIHGVISLMLAARQLGADATLLGYANSGDVTSDKTRVVGYGAVAFSYPAPPAGHILNKEQQKTLLTMARKTVEEYLTKGSIPSFDLKDKALFEKRGAFVTLTTQGNLRGCIGYIAPVYPLQRVIVETAVAAASKDPRFPPVTKGELKDLHVEISVLSPLRAIAKVQEIEVGTHGLVITKGNSSGLLLPQVATEYKWNREEFLDNTCRKAGLAAGCWKEKGTQIQIFSAQVFAEQ